jgi:hypothetical protein
VIISTHQTLEDREKAAESCSLELKISIPIIIDNMKDEVEKACAGWPDRIYIVDKKGKIAYAGGPGPRGFKPKEAEKALGKLIEDNDS